TRGLLAADPDEMRERAADWHAGSRRYFHVLCRAPESDDADVDAPVHSANKWFQQKACKTCGGCVLALRALQLGSGSQDAEDDSGDGARNRGSYLDSQRIVGADFKLGH